MASLDLSLLCAVAAMNPENRNVDIFKVPNLDIYVTSDCQGSLGFSSHGFVLNVYVKERVC